MRLYLVTHAHTCQQPERDSTRWTLSEQGRHQALALAAQPFWTEVDRVCLSTEPKTRLTVEPTLARYPLPVTKDHRFDELTRGGWVGSADYVGLVAQAFSDPIISAGGWETAQAALIRFLDGIGQLSRGYSDRTLALVGHGLTLSLYRAYLLGQASVIMADWHQLSFASVALIDPVNRQIIRDFDPVGERMDRG